MTDLAECVAQAFIRAINRHDVDALAELMSEQHRFMDSMGTVFEGPETMHRGWTKYFQIVPDYSVAVEETFCDGTVVVMLGKAEGKTPLSKNEMTAIAWWISQGAPRSAKVSSLKLTPQAKDALTADAWSKPLFILGPERGLKLLKTLPDLQAVFIDAKNQIRSSPGMTVVEGDIKTELAAGLAGRLLILKRPTDAP